MAAKIKLTMVTNFDDAEKDIKNLGKLTEQETKRIERGLERINKQNLDAFIQKNKRAAAAVTATAGKFKGLQTETRGLERKMQMLIRNGMDPQDKALLRLRTQYKLAQNSMRRMVDAQDAQKAATDRQRAAARRLEQQRKKRIASLKKMKQAINGVVLALAAAAAFKGFEFAKESVRLAEEQEVATARLISIARGVAKATDEQIESLQRLADATQKYTSFGDDVIEVGQSQLLSFGIGTKSAEKLTESLLNSMAATAGVNATQKDAILAANQFGKALEGQWGALSRVGVLMNDRQKQLLEEGDEATRVNTLIEVMEQNYGGLAAALAKTPKGQLKQLENEFTDLQEQLGQELIPIQKEFMRIQLEIFKTFSEDQSVKEFVDALMVGMKIAGVAVLGLKSGIEILVASGKFQFSALQAGIKTMVANSLDVLGTLMTNVDIASKLISGRSFKLKDQFHRNAKAMRKDVGEEVDKTKEDFNNLVESLARNGEAIKEISFAPDTEQLSILQQVVAKAQEQANNARKEKLKKDLEAEAKKLEAEKKAREAAKKAFEQSQKEANRLAEQLRQEDLTRGLDKWQKQTVLINQEFDKRKALITKHFGESSELILSAEETRAQALKDLEAEQAQDALKNRDTLQEKLLNKDAEFFTKTMSALSTHFEAMAELEQGSTEAKVGRLLEELDRIRSLESLSAQEKVIARQAVEEQILEIERKAAEESRKLAEGRMASISNMVSGLGGLFTSMDQIMKNTKQKTKAFAVLQRALAVASIGFDTQRAFTKTLADGGPFPLNVINAGIVLGEGVASGIAAATTPIPSAETGGRFEVPNMGGRVDSAVMRVNPGEDVQVTPRGEEPERETTFNIQIDRQTIYSIVQDGIDSSDITISDANLRGAF